MKLREGNVFTGVYPQGSLPSHNDFIDRQTPLYRQTPPPLGQEAELPSPANGQQVGGRHPTGMHPCLVIKLCL